MGGAEMRKYSKRIVALLMALVMAVSLCTIPAFAATSAKFDSNSYCEVKISNKLLNKKGKQYATVKLKTYDRWPGWWNNGAKVTVTMKDTKGRIIWKGQMKGGDTLKLGDDHAVYRLYFSAYKEPVKNNIWSKTFTGGNNFTNTGKCYKWTVSNAKDCTIK